MRLRRTRNPITAERIAQANLSTARANNERERIERQTEDERAAAKAAKRERRQAEREQRHEQKANGVGPWYVSATISTAISADTGWRFFGEILGITAPPEHIGMFTVLEVALFASGWSMRASVRRTAKAAAVDPTVKVSPGSARYVAWALCGLAAYMAFTLSGPIAGLARILAGPVLALIAVHQALGIEIRTHSGKHTGKLAEIGRELRERLLSRLGLADDRRDAAERIRDRAVERAARLAVAGRLTPFRRRRLARAVRIAGVATDPVRCVRMLALIAAAQHLGDLSNTAWPSPWDMSNMVAANTVPNVAPNRVPNTAVVRPNTTTDGEANTEPANTDTETNVRPITDAHRPNITARRTNSHRPVRPNAVGSALLAVRTEQIKQLFPSWRTSLPTARAIAAELGMTSSSSGAPVRKALEDELRSVTAGDGDAEPNPQALIG